MALITVELEYDGEELGPDWLTEDNLKSLLYSEAKTSPSLLSLINYKKED